MRARHFNCELAAGNYGNRTKIHRGKDANRNSHVPAAGATMFFDVFIYVIVIDRVPVDRAVGMNMGKNLTMLTALAVLGVIFIGMAVLNAVAGQRGATAFPLLGP
jgi:hypothetical protein